MLVQPGTSNYAAYMSALLDRRRYVNASEEERRQNRHDESASSKTQ